MTDDVGRVVECVFGRLFMCAPEKLTCIDSTITRQQNEGETVLLMTSRHTNATACIVTHTPLHIPSTHPSFLLLGTHSIDQPHTGPSEYSCHFTFPIFPSVPSRNNKQTPTPPLPSSPLSSLHYTQRHKTLKNPSTNITSLPIYIYRCKAQNNIEPFITSFSSGLSTS